MIRGSLVLKLYLYALAAFFLLSAGGAWLIDRTVRDEQRQVWAQAVEDRVRFVAGQVQTIPKGAPDEAERLAELERGLGVRLQLVPWDHRDRYPATLDGQDVVTDVQRQGNRTRRAHWIRVQRPGAEVEALSVRYGRSFGGRRMSRATPFLLSMLMLALLLLPPLILWVIRPLRKLEAAVQRLGAGDLETPVELNRRDELGRLAEAFDQMRRQVQRMIYEKERLLGDISHELRGPLGRMTLAQTLLEEDIGDNPYLRRMQGDVAQMETLVGELLALARYRLPATLTLVPVRLDEIAGKLLDERSLTFEQGGYQVSSRLDPAPVQGDLVLLGRALSNLLDNARKYTPPGGKLTVSTGSDGQTSTFKVQDSGVGIPAAALPHLFEPFFRPDSGRAREAGGVGLGLAIVKAVVDRHGGRIHVSSEEGQGTAVEITLPAADAPSLPA